jgi:anti-sigma regulatory factor (Ser/Thr protein kinase)
MAVCTLSIPPDTEQVRVARLVACAAARRTGLIEAQIDDVRLAVGEAVGRAVVRQQREDAPEPVSVRMIDDAAVSWWKSATQLPRARTNLLWPWR